MEAADAGPAGRGARPFAFSLGTNALVGACALVTGGVLARYLGPEGRGQLAAVVLWPDLLMMMASLGGAPTVAYFVSSEPGRARSIYGQALLLAAGQALTVGLAGLAVLPLALGPRYAEVLSWAFVYLCFAPLAFVGAVHAGTLQGAMRMGRHSIHRLSATLTYLAGLGVLVMFHQTLTVAQVVLVLGLSLLASVVSGILMVRGVLGRPSNGDSSLVGRMLHYGLRTQAAQLTQNLGLKLGALVVSLFAAASVLGQYAVAVGATSFFVTFGQALGLVVLPDVAGRGPAERGQRVAVHVRRSILVLAPLTLGLVAAAPWLIRWVFGPEFEAAVPLTRVLAVAAFFVGLGAVLGDGLRGMSLPALPALTEAASLTVFGVLLWLLVPGRGPMGAALASLLSCMLGFALLAASLCWRAALAPSALVPGAADGRAVWNALRAPWRR